MLHLAVETLVGGGASDELAVDEISFLRAVGEVLHEGLSGRAASAGGLEGDGRQGSVSAIGVYAVSGLLAFLCCLDCS